MKRIVLVFLIALIALADSAFAARVRVRRGPAGRVHVTVRRDFPIRRTLPHVVVRPAPVVRVTPRVYLAPVAFGAVVVTSAAKTQVWHESEALEREDGWTDFTKSVDRRGDRLLLEIERGAAQLSFAEVVFENGETQVVDFDDRTHARGTYNLLEFRDGRKIDHIRVIAKAASNETEITLRLVS